MKKILIAIAMLLMLGLGAKAQYTDGFFNRNTYNRLDEVNGPGF